MPEGSCIGEHTTGRGAGAMSVNASVVKIALEPDIACNCCGATRESTSVHNHQSCFVVERAVPAVTQMYSHPRILVGTIRDDRAGRERDHRIDPRTASTCVAPCSARLTSLPEPAPTTQDFREARARHIPIEQDAAVRCCGNRSSRERICWWPIRFTVMIAWLFGVVDPITCGDRNSRARAGRPLDR